MNEASEPLQDEARDILSGALKLGVQLDAASAERLARFIDVVYRENERYNLTGIPREQAVALHILDSLAGLPSMLSAPDGKWLDLGSGAGLPGVPLAVAADRNVDLLESVGKKARFLERVLRELCLGGTVLGQRAEEAAAQRPGAYSAVAARAVSELPALVELASPLLAPGGLLVCWKGQPSAEELRRGDAAADQVGLGRGRIEVTVLPGASVGRCLVVYQRIAEPRVRLPRRIGLAQSRPLA